MGNIQKNEMETQNNILETTEISTDNIKNEEEKPKEGVYSHKFKTPFKYTIKQGEKMEERVFETLNFNFERLTGRDMINIENEMQAMKEYALAPEISRSFQCKMAAKASGISSDVLENMPINEFNKITNAARDFLISTGY